MTDTHAQLTILADALTEVIDLAGDKSNMPVLAFVERFAELAASA